ncbi:MAG: DNA-directed RNA polymerase subunit L [Halobacteriota archaeon]|nr:DNA-directed RNA polymerase subunit L [Halobacteriota archaeon]
MEIRLLESIEDEITIELKGESHTFLNALKSTLLQDEKVLMVTYNIKHPSISPAIMYLRTKDSEPIEVLKNAASVLRSQCEEFNRIFNEKTAI